VPSPSLPLPVSSDSRTLGVLWILYGLLRLAVALLLTLYSGTATLMFGALLVRVPHPFFMMDMFHFFYAVVIILIIVSGILALLAGFALFTGRPVHLLPLVAAFFALADLPLGATLGIYTLIRFLRVS
jgi:hypothetical protein